MDHGAHLSTSQGYMGIITAPELLEREKLGSPYYSLALPSGGLCEYQWPKLGRR